MLKKIFLFKAVNFKNFRLFIYIPLIILFLAMFILFKNPVLVEHAENEVNGIASEVQLKEIVTALTKGKTFRNYQHIDKLNESATFIFNKLEKIGLKPIFQKYKYEGEEYKNIIIKFGSNKKLSPIIFGAHYDVCFDTPGADDNASGVAGLIELARLLKLHESNLNHPIEIVFYTLEEPPFFRSEEMGSYIHAKSKFDNNQKIELMISVEMIGYFSDEYMSQEYPMYLMYLFYPTQANFIALVGTVKDLFLTRKVKSYLKIGTKIDVRSINAPSKLSGIDFSDHLNYWKFNYPALMVTDTSFYRNKNYHKITDTADTLNYQKMSYVVDQLLRLALDYK